MGSPVVILSSESLRLAQEVSPVVFELTGLDHIMGSVPYQKRVLFYRDGSHEEVMKLLRKSLGEVLVTFYPLAGRMRTSFNGTLELDCRDLSVKFSEATTDATLDDLGDFEPCDFCDSLCDMKCSPQHPWTFDIPLLFVQVTKFGCGGISIGISYSHQVIDGISSWEFIKAWAEMARTGNISVTPEIRYRSCSNDSRVVNKLTVQPSLLVKPELGIKKFKMNKAAIQLLKSQAAKVKTDVEFSTLEVICAHFWRRVTMAKDLPKFSRSDFMVLLDCRGRIKSIPSKAYFGNAVWSSVASAIVAQLEQEDISFAASLIHEAIIGFNSEKAEDVYHRRRTIPVNSNLDVDNGSKPYTLVAINSPKHPVFECDFGIGKPLGVTIGTNDLHDGQISLFPSADDGVDITVVLTPLALEKL